MRAARAVPAGLAALVLLLGAAALFRGGRRLESPNAGLGPTGETPASLPDRGGDPPSPGTPVSDGSTAALPKRDVAAFLPEFRRLAAAIRAQGRPAGAADRLIRGACLSAAPELNALLREDPVARARWFELALEETDRALAVGMASLLRPHPDDDGTRARRAAEDPSESLRAAALASLASPSTPAGLDALERAARREPSEELRDLALESVGISVERYRGGSLEIRVLSLLQGAAEQDASERVRATALEGLARLMPEGPERAQFLERRLQAETSSALRERLRSLAGGEPK